VGGRRETVVKVEKGEVIGGQQWNDEGEEEHELVEKRKGGENA